MFIVATARNGSMNMALLNGGPSTTHRLWSSDLLATHPTFNYTRRALLRLLSNSPQLLIIK
jgi:hypothetical protein